MMIYKNNTIPVSTPIKLIILNEQSTDELKEYNNLPRRYQRLIRMARAYYYNCNVVVEAHKDILLIRKAIAQDFINVAESYVDDRANKVVYKEGKPIKLNRRMKMLDLISRERMYSNIEQTTKGKELQERLSKIGLDKSMRNSSMLKILEDEGHISVEVISNTLLSKVRIEEGNKEFGFYEFMDSLNINVVSER